MNKITDRYRVFKPVSLSASQIGADIVTEADLLFRMAYAIPQP